MNEQERRAPLRAAVDQARRQRLAAAADDLRSPGTRDASPPPGDHSDPVRDRPRSWEERQEARREAAKSLVDPALAVAPHVVKLVHPQAGDRLEEAVQALDRVTGNNIDGALAAASAAARDVERRVRERTDKVRQRGEDRRHPAQNPRRQR